MEIFQGTEGFGNAALGVVKFINKNKKANAAFDSDYEMRLYEDAKERAIGVLKADEGAASKLMLLSDHQLEDAIYARILNNRLYAQDAIKEAGDCLEQILASNTDSYLHAKGSDIRSITKLLLTSIADYDGPDAVLPENCIVVAKSLSSSQFLKLDKEHVRAIVVEHSSLNSHMAILAKAMDIPTIVGCEVSEGWDGKNACVDGAWRAIYIDPDKQTTEDMKERIAENHNRLQEYSTLKGQECMTLDGHTIHMFANICSVREIKAALDNDCEGVGLYRTETSFVNRNYPPTEEELFEEYKSLAAAFGNNGVTIRTVDIGTDKDIPYIDLKREENAALGVRGIRLSLRFPEIFKIQVRAILRAAAYGNLSIMFPMISTVKEFLQAKSLVEGCFRELMASDVPCREVAMGAMIETPAAVMISDELAHHAAFLSIGTNDLTQYTLGVDRENKELSDIIDYHHPAILKMLQIVCDNARKMKIPVGICGELALDEQLSAYFVEIGVDSLSVAPSKILPLKKHIMNIAIGK